MDIALQVVSVLGAGLILGAFYFLQRGWVTSHDGRYLWANFLGAVGLTIVAVADRRAGFIILEATWALVSLWSIVRGTRPPATPAL